ncbi:UxaA family hydrolase [Maribacter luteus]|uniref:UxaA family hydrolase n=1 Tax=Maribacter luteus TaxID=2594478 RepID=UPI0024919497|nr:UxaA family hydrolase [Maribacter luteus]
MERFVQLHAHDNIIIALKHFETGTILNVNGNKIKLKEAIVFGHKIAVKPIFKSDKILKYGLSIGRATQNIVPGEHVHSHNLETDYLISDSK